jgi:hypothetical protein
LTFLDNDNPNYSRSDGKLMQHALKLAAEYVNVNETDPEHSVLARFIRAAFIIGNRDAEAMAQFAADAVLTKRRRAPKGDTAP